MHKLKGHIAGFKFWLGQLLTLCWSLGRLLNLSVVQFLPRNNKALLQRFNEFNTCKELRTMPGIQ